MTIFNSYVCLPEGSTIFGHLAEKARQKPQSGRKRLGMGPNMRESSQR